MPPTPSKASRRAAVSAGRAVAGFTLACGVVLGTAYAAGAAPDPGYPSQQQVDDARAAADSASARVAELDSAYAESAVSLQSLQERAASIGEQANGAKWALDQRTREAREAARRADAATKAAADAATAVREYAAVAYQQGGSLGSLEPLFDAAGPQELSDKMSALAFVGDLYAEKLRTASLASGTARSLRAAADAARSAQQDAVAKAAEADRTARAELAQAQSETARVGAERDRLAAELARLRHTSKAIERARLDGLAAAAQAAADQPSSTSSSTSTSAPTSTSTSTTPTSTTTHPTSTSTTSTSTTTSTTSTTTSTSTSSTSSTSHPTSTSTSTTPTSTTSTTHPTSTSTTTTPSSTTTTTTPPPPPPSGGAAAAVAYAQAQLGKPYEWGASGPDTFDCSGLTMMAWRQAGVYLDHYTGAQWTETARVPLDSLQPGDIVFYGATGETSYHVGLYVGGGQMIEAPHTGAFVRYASIYRSDLLPYGGRPS